MLRLHPAGFFDPPVVLDCSITSIPGSGSSPLQVVASMGQAAHYVRFLDGVGRYVGVYVGAVGQEQLKAIIGGGSHEEVGCEIPAGARVSLRNLESDAITTGSLCVQFLHA